jgi:hypothetical protein
MDRMRVELLGPLRVRDESGAEVAIPGQRTLLARLALEPGRAVSVAALIDALWPADPPANAAGALHTQLSRLRGPLGAHLESGPGGYRLAGVETDVEAFEQMSTRTEAASREDSPANVRARAETALALWRGPALAGLDGYEFAEAVLADLAAAMAPIPCTNRTPPATCAPSPQPDAGPRRSPSTNRCAPSSPTSSASTLPLFCATRAWTCSAASNRRRRRRRPVCHSR